MPVYNTGLKSLKVGDFNPADGAVSNLVEVAVYKDTLKITETEPTQTKHYQAGKTAPKKIHYEAGEETVKFSVMDTSADSLLACLGGTVTTVNSVKTWNKAKGVQKERIKALVAETSDGALIKIPRGSWIGVKNFDLADAAIGLIDITVTPTDTGIDNIPDFTVTDPED
ncbi:Uncharacterised protein [Sphingobacterium spiritivorum]|uniref:Phage tail protein n=1 Tax=Sphingobacterium spiritivorum TaxID=258 RepID=A0A380CSZ1_SPHSI|nr:hypothetical protein [Sphingobacterium spiritivorum]SUJ26542.1 Uncharacterised protein [Sphingobacterium spiritivorum]